MAAYGRVTLNRGGRNSRFDCMKSLFLAGFCNEGWFSGLLFVDR